MQVFLRGRGEVGGHEGHRPVDQRGKEHVECVLSSCAHADSVDVRMGRPQLFERRIKCFCPGRGGCGHAKGPHAPSSVFGGRPTSDQRTGREPGGHRVGPRRSWLDEFPTPPPLAYRNNYPDLRLGVPASTQTSPVLGHERAPDGTRSPRFWNLSLPKVLDPQASARRSTR